VNATYLFSWNPTKWEWKGFEAAAAKVSRGTPRRDFWTCGNTKRIQKGDRFLFIRLGSEPRGIIGGGRILSDPRLVDHWDDSRRARGVAALGADILFDHLSVLPVVPMDELKSEYPDVWWTPQSSGMLLPGAMRSFGCSTIIEASPRQTTTASVKEFGPSDPWGQFPNPMGLLPHSRTA
jgi:hypothetical protein